METNVIEKNPMENRPAVDHNDRKDHALRRQALRNSGSIFSVVIHLVVYLSINLLLFFINLATFNGIWWVMWPVFGWGLGLFCHAVVSFLVPSIRSVRRRLYHQELDRLRGRA